MTSSTGDASNTNVSSREEEEAVAVFLGLPSEREIAEVTSGTSTPKYLRSSASGHVLDISALNDDSHTYLEVLEDSSTGKESQDELLPRRLATGKRIFILRKTTEAQKRARIYIGSRPPETNLYTNQFNYLKKYPEAEPEQAIGPDARVWRVYLDEAAEFDIDMVDNFKDTVDVILVFAGLFSAVVTTFVVQASNALRLDYAQVMASVLLEQLAVQRAFISGLSIPEPQPSTLGLDSTTTTGLDRWTNGLWFTSLSFSLATALFAMLVKQWIQAYASPVSAGSPQIQARIRQYRYMGLQKWHVPLIVGLLPILLHLSLLLFLLGLVIFLVSLDHAIAGISALVTMLVYTIYIITNLAPVYDPQCPYKTPISTYSFKCLQPYISKTGRITQYARNLNATILLWVVRLKRGTTNTLRSLHRMLWWFPHYLIPLFHKISKRPQRHKAERMTQRILAADSLKGAELSFMESQGEETDAYALCWVLKWSSNPSVTEIVFEAVGDLPLGFNSKAKQILMDEGVGHAACSMLKTCTANSRRPDHPLAHKRINQAGWAKPRPGFERMYQKSSLVHFQFAFRKVPEWSGQPSYGSPNNARCTCNAAHRPKLAFSIDQDPGDDTSDPYFSLFLSPSKASIDPAYLARCTPPRLPKIVFLHLLRRAIQFLRIEPYLAAQKSDKFSWHSCCKLLNTVNLNPHQTDLFGIWRSTLVPLYLVSFLHQQTPILKDYILAHDLSLNRIEPGTLDLSLHPARPRLLVECCVEILIAMLQAEGTIASMDASVWSEIRAFTEELAHCFSGRYYGSIAWEMTDAGPRCTLLDALLNHSEQCGHSIIELRMLIYSLSCNLWEGGQGLASRPGVIPPLPYQRLIRATLVEPLVDSQKNSDGTFSLVYIHRCLRLVRILLKENDSRIADAFKQLDGIGTLRNFLSFESTYRLEYEGLVKNLEIYIRQVLDMQLAPDGPVLDRDDTSQCSKSGATQPELQRDSDRSAHLDYLFRNLVPLLQVCVCTEVSQTMGALNWQGIPWCLRLHDLARIRPERQVWEDAFSQLGLSHAWSTSQEEEEATRTMQVLRSVLQEAEAPVAPVPAEEPLS